jgi:hypothetical protein
LNEAAISTCVIFEILDDDCHFGLHQCCFFFLIQLQALDSPFKVKHRQVPFLLRPELVQLDISYACELVIPDALAAGVAVD